MTEIAATAEQPLSGLDGRIKTFAAVTSGDFIIDKSSMYVAPLPITTGSEDRAGERVDPAGIITTAYEQNPVVFFVHSHKSMPLVPPIGQANKPDGTFDCFRVNDPVLGDIWKSGCTFSQATKFAGQIFALVAEGTVRGRSIGAIAHKYVPYKPQLPGVAFVNGEIRPARRSSVICKSAELYEWSWTPIPCNRDAVIALKSMMSHGVIDGLPIDPMLSQVMKSFDLAEPVQVPGFGAGLGRGWETSEIDWNRISTVSKGDGEETRDDHGRFSEVAGASAAHEAMAALPGISEASKAHASSARALKRHEEGNIQGAILAHAHAGRNLTQAGNKIGGEIGDQYHAAAALHHAHAERLGKLAPGPEDGGASAKAASTGIGGPLSPQQHADKFAAENSDQRRSGKGGNDTLTIRGNYMKQSGEGAFRGAADLHLAARVHAEQNGMKLVSGTESNGLYADEHGNTMSVQKPIGKSGSNRSHAVVFGQKEPDAQLSTKAADVREPAGKKVGWTGPAKAAEIRDSFLKKAGATGTSAAQHNDRLQINGKRVKQTGGAGLEGDSELHDHAKEYMGKRGFEKAPDESARGKIPYTMHRDEHGNGIELSKRGDKHVVTFHAPGKDRYGAKLVDNTAAAKTPRSTGIPDLDSAIKESKKLGGGGMQQALDRLEAHKARVAAHKPYVHTGDSGSGSPHAKLSDSELQQEHRTAQRAYDVARSSRMDGAVEKRKAAWSAYQKVNNEKEHRITAGGLNDDADGTVGKSFGFIEDGLLTSDLLKSQSMTSVGFTKLNGD